jgi:flavin reductase (DIM6/NTAB) family NADH-FMN oxidoreductase RutF
MAEEMVLCSTPLPRGENELDLAKLSCVPSSSNTAPTIAECPVSLECDLLEIKMVGNNRLVFGEVKIVTARPGIVDEKNWRVKYDGYDPVGRLRSPDGYCVCLPYSIKMPGRNE